MAKSILHGEMATVSNLFLVIGEVGSATYEVHEVDKLMGEVNRGLTIPDQHEQITDRHYGSERELRPYEISDGWSGRTVINDSNISLLLQEDLDEIAEGLELVDRFKDYRTKIAQILAGNIVLGSGLASDHQLFKKYLGPGTRLFVGEPEEGAIISITESMLPCAKPAKLLFDELGNEEGFSAFTARFKDVAHDLRGYRGSVISSGKLAVGDSVALQLPIDHRVITPGWDKQLASSQYLELGIADINLLAELSRLSVNDIASAIDDGEPVTVFPLDYEKPTQLNKTLMLCGVDELTWPDQLRILPGWNGNEPVPLNWRLDTKGYTAAEFIWESAYGALNIEGDEDDQVEGFFEFNNGRGLKVRVKVECSFSTIYGVDITDGDGNFLEEGESRLDLRSPEVEVFIERTQTESDTIIGNKKE